MPISPEQYPNYETDDGWQSQVAAFFAGLDPTNATANLTDKDIFDRWHAMWSNIAGPTQIVPRAPLDIAASDADQVEIAKFFAGVDPSQAQRVGVDQDCFTRWNSLWTHVASQPPPPPVVAKGEQIGFSNGNELLWMSDGDLARELDMQVDVHAKWVRVGIDWNSIQSYGPAYWNWRHTDRLVHACLDRGLRIMFTATYTPRWARQSAYRGSLFSPPRNVNEFTAVCTAAAQRYAPLGIHHWEIWNEPNWKEFWYGAPDVAAYVRLLKVSYTAIHQADANAFVISGGLAPNGDLGRNPTNPIAPVNFLKAMYASGAKGSFDAFGMHPYGPRPNHPLAGKIGWNALLQSSMFHQIMTDNDDGHKQVWGTEAGYPTAGVRSVDESTQAQFLYDQIVYWDNLPYAGPLFIQSLRDFTQADPTSPGANMGLVHRDFREKPAYGKIKSLLS